MTCASALRSADDHSLVVTAHPGVFAVLRELGRCVPSGSVLCRRRGRANSIEPLARLETAEALEDFADPLMSRILELDGPDAARVAVSAFVVGRSLDRIGDRARSCPLDCTI
ncbi:MAG: hypothetical protein R2710_02515 [Acidimicrobiales bacterium]